MPVLIANKAGAPFAAGFFVSVVLPAGLENGSKTPYVAVFIETFVRWHAQIGINPCAERV
ncbi:hypothetical protein COO20_23365 [Thalassospira marina]|uniref:Uncharacterized protein n=1 Tax=Thalassospira marina TaxID=2048283 RepID=A0A2N3KEI4_9PROT|nr:hypothetical protein COO20_23365 [Thalassospira marina]